MSIIKHTALTLGTILLMSSSAFANTSVTSHEQLANSDIATLVHYQPAHTVKAQNDTGTMDVASRSRVRSR